MVPAQHRAPPPDGQTDLSKPGTAVTRRGVLAATVTPLASILGSGLLIIVPVLERTLGGLAVLGAIAVSAVAWWAGTAIRHCVRVVEPLDESGELDKITGRLGWLADAVIVHRVRDLGGAVPAHHGGLPGRLPGRRRIVRSLSA